MSWLASFGAVLALVAIAGHPTPVWVLPVGGAAFFGVFSAMRAVGHRIGICSCTRHYACPLHREEKRVLRRDYERIAAAIAAVDRGVARGEIRTPEMAVDAVVQAVSAVMADDNPRFDADRFASACRQGGARARRLAELTRDSQEMHPEGYA